jgi:hypothetical protein
MAIVIQKSCQMIEDLTNLAGNPVFIIFKMDYTLSKKYILQRWRMYVLDSVMI